MLKLGEHGVLTEDTDQNLKIHLKRNVRFYIVQKVHCIQSGSSKKKIRTMLYRHITNNSGQRIQSNGNVVYKCKDIKQLSL